MQEVCRVVLHKYRRQPPKNVEDADSSIGTSHPGKLDNLNSFEAAGEVIIENKSDEEEKDDVDAEQFNILYGDDLVSKNDVEELQEDN